MAHRQILFNSYTQGFMVLLFLKCQWLSEFQHQSTGTFITAAFISATTQCVVV